MILSCYFQIGMSIGKRSVLGLQRKKRDLKGMKKVTQMAKLALKFIAEDIGW